MTTINRRILFRRGTAADWTAANPVLAAGEAGYETDTGNLKLGDGATAWASLAYATLSSEGVRDLVAAFIVAGDGCTVLHNDPGDSLTITVQAEFIRDTIAAFAVAGSGVTVAHDDGADTLTISADAEYIRDTVASFVTAGSNVTVVHDDGANTLTISSTGGGGGSAVFSRASLGLPIPFL